MVSEEKWLAGYSAEVIKRASKIKLLLMDVDGVLTDGRLYYIPGENGTMVETKGFNSQDGIGFHMMNAVGIIHGVISGRVSPATIERASMLKMRFVYQGHLEKASCFEEAMKEAGVTEEETGFIGDDFTDVPLIVRSGLGVAVGNAREEVKERADLISKFDGGDGAVREVAELLLKAQNHWASNDSEIQFARIESDAARQNYEVGEWIWKINSTTPSRITII